MAEVYRPNYQIVVSPKGGMMPRDVKDVLLRALPGQTVGGILGRYQTFGAEDGANWLIDQDGVVYELAGWDRVAPGRGDQYTIDLVLDTPDYPPPQREALGWLLGQLRRKKGVPELEVNL